jgi:hypothetical protein
LKSREYDTLLVSSYLPDLYVGDFFEWLSHMPSQPCSIVMQEGRTPAATLLEMKNMVGEDNTRKDEGCGCSQIYS